MKQIRTLLANCAALIALSALASCSDHNEPETNPTDNPDQVVMPSVSIEGNVSADVSAITRADNPYKPDNNSKLYLYSGSVTANAPQGTYVYNSNAWTAETSKSLYWDDAVNTSTGNDRIYSFYALANKGTLDISSGTGTVSPNQGVATGIDATTAKANYAAANLLMAYSYTEKRAKGTSVPFTLKHLMAQFTVTLTTPADKDGFKKEYLSNATATTQLRSGYTLKYAAIGTTDAANKAKSAPATTTAIGSATTDFTMLRTVNYMDNDETKDVESVTFTCIAPPQAVTKVVVTINGNDYTATLTDATLLQGYNTVQPLVAKPSGFSLLPGTIQVTAWEDVQKESHELTTDDIITGSENLEGIKEAGMLKLYAYKESDSQIHQDGIGSYPVVYGTEATINKDASAGYSPIIWEKLTKTVNSTTGNLLQKYVYAATFEPTGYIHADATNSQHHEKDLLAGISASTPWGTSPSFIAAATADDTGTKLKHLNSRFTVKLFCSDDTYTADQMNNAILTTVRKKIMMAANPFTVTKTSVTPNTTDATGTAEENTVTLINTSNATGTGDSEANAAQFTAILAPQTLGTADNVVLRLSISSKAGLKDYTLALPNGVTLDSGKNYILSAQLKKTDLTVGNISVQAWDEVKGSGDFEM